MPKEGNLNQNFFCSKEKEITKIVKDGNEIVVTISYKIKLINIGRFMTTSLSNPVDIVIERIHKTKCKDYGCFLKYESVKDNSIKCKCLSPNKNCSNKIY